MSRIHGRRASLPIDAVAPYKPVYLCGMEELAVRQYTLEPSGGVLFARNRERESKDTARQAIIDLFSPQRWPGNLHVLTLPGLDWKFERLLLAVRNPGWFQASKPNGTYFTSVESDRSIYFSSVTHMPGVETPRALIRPIKSERVRPFAEMGVKTRYASFFFADVDDLMKQQTWDGGWDAAWLDYTGPLTVERMRLIQNFFHTLVRDTLIVTSMKARWNEATSAAVAKAGSHSQWLRQSLFGEILHDLEYFDTVPMAQFAVRHPIENLGLGYLDARTVHAEIAAAGQGLVDAHRDHADGGTNNPNDLGQSTVDARTPNAEIAAAGHGRRDAHGLLADGGPIQTRRKKCRKSKQSAIKKQRPKKRGVRSANVSRPKSAKPSRAAKPRRQVRRRKPPQRSVRTKPRAKPSAKRTKQ
jgi:hypothetical protein